MLSRILPALLIAPWPAAAQIAPDDLWRAWQTDERPRAEAEDVARVDGTVRLGGLILELTEGLVLQMDEAVLVPDGEAVLIRPDARMSLRYTPASGAPIPVEITAPQATIRVSGAVEAPAYTLTAPRLDAASASLATDLTLSALSVSYATDGPPPDLTLTAETLALASTVPTASGDLRIDTEIAEIDGTADLPAAGEAVIDVSGQESVWGYAFAGPEGPERDIRVEMVTGGLDHGVTLSEEGLSHESTTEDLRLTALGADVPLTEATARIGRLVTNASGPLPGAEGPQPASLELAVEEVTAGEQVWDLIDPGGALPRDPAALSLETRGRLAIEAGQIRPVSMVLTALEIEALGARLSGEGDAIFEEGPEGRPRPVGRVDLRATGFSELLTTLADIGAVPPAEAIGARIALMSLTRAAGDGERTTSLVFAPDGTITLNGQSVGRLPVADAP